MECSCGSFSEESDVTDIVARLSSSMARSDTRRKEQQRPMMRDFAVDTISAVLARGPSLSEPGMGDEKKLKPLFERAVGLGTKETLPSLPSIPVPSEDINELVCILRVLGEKEERDEGLFGDRGGKPS
mmetsp:Transcript_9383/g.22246  ORF Transcript_9383/g.22246 Transcript_9383/m.22246 type:complete len:128 (+) Transcript_9383:1107-1490(+)